jgi:TetR/AcrR family transcriptional regulator, transcriptional repressor for nem operon
MFENVSKTKILEAAVKVFRTKGYTATRVEDLCAEAGLTKGGFFHHFKSKEDVALSALEYWNATASEMFGGAPFMQLTDPLARLLGYIDLRKELLQGSLAEVTCLAGTLAQEMFDSSPAIRAAAERAIRTNAEWVTELVRDAKRVYAPDATWSPESLALYTQSALQGGFVVGKAYGDVHVIGEAVDHLRRYVVSLFPQP